MAGVTVSVDLEAAPDAVWADVERIEDHVEWMADAESIIFIGERRRGAGVRAEVATRFGPLRTTDVMEFTEWEPPHRMAVRHVGLFTGTGAFTLTEIEPGRTRFTWSERIEFPWFFGGRVGAWLARPVFRWVWRRNLRRLAARFNGPGTPPSASPGTH